MLFLFLDLLFRGLITQGTWPRAGVGFNCGPLLHPGSIYILGINLSPWGLRIPEHPTWTSRQLENGSRFLQSAFLILGEAWDILREGYLCLSFKVWKTYWVQSTLHCFFWLSRDHRVKCKGQETPSWPPHLASPASKRDAHQLSPFLCLQFWAALAAQALRTQAAKQIQGPWPSPASHPSRRGSQRVIELPAPPKERTWNLEPRVWVPAPASPA